MQRFTSTKKTPIKKQRIDYDKWLVFVVEPAFVVGLKCSRVADARSKRRMFSPIRKGCYAYERTHIQILKEEYSSFTHQQIQSNEWVKNVWGFSDTFGLSGGFFETNLNEYTHLVVLASKIMFQPPPDIFVKRHDPKPATEPNRPMSLLIGWVWNELSYIIDVDMEAYPSYAKSERKKLMDGRSILAKRRADCVGNNSAYLLYINVFFAVANARYTKPIETYIIERDMRQKQQSASGQKYSEHNHSVMDIMIVDSNDIIDGESIKYKEFTMPVPQNREIDKMLNWILTTISFRHDTMDGWMIVFYMWGMTTELNMAFNCYGDADHIRVKNIQSIENDCIQRLYRNVKEVFVERCAVGALHQQLAMCKELDVEIESLIN